MKKLIIASFLLAGISLGASAQTTAAKTTGSKPRTHVAIASTGTTGKTNTVKSMTGTTGTSQATTPKRNTAAVTHKKHKAHKKLAKKQ